MSKWEDLLQGGSSDHLVCVCVSVLLFVCVCVCVCVCEMSAPCFPFAACLRVSRPIKKVIKKHKNTRSRRAASHSDRSENLSLFNYEIIIILMSGNKRQQQTVCLCMWEPTASRGLIYGA